MDGTVAIVGAGPYGLSVAAHLRAAGVPALLIGRPMECWQAMPRGMFLRSAWSASCLGAPHGRCDLDQYVRETGAAVPVPIPLADFVDYGLWFQRQAVGEAEETYVRALEVDGAGFRLELDDGRALRACRVVLATGIRTFPRLPGLARGLPAELATHSQDHRDFDAFAGRDVAVVGGGQSALECAALLHEAGARVELLVRREVTWLRFHDSTGRARRLVHAPSDVGPPGLSWLIHFGRVFRLLPDPVRGALGRRSTRPAAARWLYDRVTGRVALTQHVEVARATPRGGRLELALSDGSARTVDHLLFATGYQPHLDRLPFLGPGLRRRLRERDGQPCLDGAFESSVPGLHFVGRLADRSHGPICRFVSGAQPTARRLAARVRAAAGSP